MAIPAILISQCRAEYSENILPIASTFNVDFPVNSIGDGSVIFDSANKFDGDKSIFMFQSASISPKDTAFNFNSSLSSTASEEGSHILSFKLLDISNGLVDYTFRVLIWVNAVNVQTLELEVAGNIAVKDVWRTFAQSIYLNAGETIDYSFEIYTPAQNPVNELRLNLDSFKLEIDNRNLGAPSVYSLPVVSSTALSYIFKAANYALTSADETVEVTVSSVQTLPSAIGLLNKFFRVINATSGQVTVDTTASQTIGNKVSGNQISIILQPEEYLEVISNGINYRII